MRQIPVVTVEPNGSNLTSLSLCLPHSVCVRMDMVRREQAVLCHQKKLHRWNLNILVVYWFMYVCIYQPTIDISWWSTGDHSGSVVTLKNLSIYYLFYSKSIWYEAKIAANKSSVSEVLWHVCVFFALYKRLPLHVSFRRGWWELGSLTSATWLMKHLQMIILRQASLATNKNTMVIWRRDTPHPPCIPHLGGISCNQLWLPSCILMRKHTMDVGCFLLSTLSDKSCATV